jgi:hypothetical protein
MKPFNVFGRNLNSGRQRGGDFDIDILKILSDLISTGEILAFLKFPKISIFNAPPRPTVSLLETPTSPPLLAQQTR